MKEVFLLDLYPNKKKPIQDRIAPDIEDRRKIARRFDKEFFDGDRGNGYGGYYYDGRWKPVVKRFIDYYGLTSQSSVLDIGCAKGFMLRDFVEALPGMRVAGIDISQYGIENAEEIVKPYVQVGNAVVLPYPDKSFDLVISINVVHNLDREGCKKAIREMMRVSKRFKYIQVDSFRNAKEEQNLKNWYLTAKLILGTEEWKEIFKEVGYDGEYYWTIIE